MRLHGYFRSSAAWRVRIALGLKRIAYDQTSHDLRLGQQHSADYLAINPQGLVPALVIDDGTALNQSLAICEYLDEVVPEPPLLPDYAIGRAKVRALAQIVACDIHPVQNLKILKRLRNYGLDQEAVQLWARTTIAEGLDSYEMQIAATAGRFSFGDAPSLADLCLIPQLGNARRFGVPLDYPRICRIEQACASLPAFVAAAPDMQSDAD